MCSEISGFASTTLAVKATGEAQGNQGGGEREWQQRCYGDGSRMRRNKEAAKDGWGMVTGGKRKKGAESGGV